MKRKGHHLLMACMIIVCCLLAGCQSVNDFSAFSKFSYRLTLLAIYNNQSFVIEEGMIYAAEITRNEDAYLLTMSVIESGQADTDECLFSYPMYGMECIAVKQLEPRELNSEEIESVKSVFGEIVVESVFVSAGTRIEASAPSISMTWDDFGASNQPAAEGPDLVNMLPEQTVEPVTELLLQLTPIFYATLGLK